MDNPDEELAPELKELLERFRTADHDPLGMEEVFARLIKESDIAAALLAVSFLDLLLALLIARRLIDPQVADKLLGFESGNRALSPFAVRIELAFALGGIGPETRNELGLLRKIRNKVAHSHDVLGFEDEQIKSWCNELNSPKWDGLVPGIAMGGRSQFVFTAVKLSIRLRELMYESKPPAVGVDKEITTIHVASGLSGFGIARS